MIRISIMTPTARLSLWNLSGEKLLEVCASRPGTETTLPNSGLGNGVYLLRAGDKRARVLQAISISR